jgi:two-component SAPR family response regulator
MALLNSLLHWLKKSLSYLNIRQKMASSGLLYLLAVNKYRKSISGSDSSFSFVVTVLIVFLA